MHTITISEAKSILEKIIRHGNQKLSVFLHSSPGIGKSSIVKQIGVECNLPIIDLRLGSIEPTDLCGIPFVRDGEQVWSTPSWFPQDPDSKGILFLDELSNANVNVQQAGRCSRRCTPC